MMVLVDIIFLQEGQPLNFYRLVNICARYIKMQGDIPLDMISVEGWENPHPGMKCPYNIKWP